MNRITITAALLAVTVTAAHAGSGAIAVSISDGVIGFAHGSGSEIDAARWALLDCRDKGGADCRVLGAETEQCLVLLRGPDKYVTGYSIYTNYSREVSYGMGAEKSYLNNATDRAKKMCGDDCELKAWVCG